MKYFETGSPIQNFSFDTVRLSFNGHLAALMESHEVEGESFLPVDGYLHILSEAWKRVSGSDSLNVEVFHMVKPIRGRCNDVEARLKFSRVGDEVRFLLSTGPVASPEGQINARGRFLINPPAKPLEKWDRHSRDFGADGDIFRRKVGANEGRVNKFIALGDYYNGLESVRSGPDGFISTVRVQGSMEERHAKSKSIAACIESLLRYCDYALSSPGYHIPYAIDSISLAGSVQCGAYQCHGRILPKTAEDGPLIADVALIDGYGATVLRLSGIRLIEVKGKKGEPKSESDNGQQEAIAVIGMSCRFPGAASLGKYWDNLRNGVLSVAGIPDGRWKGFEGWYDPTAIRPGTGYSALGGFIEGHDLFDPRFFGISPADAEIMDPQQRVFLQEAWKAIENGGYAPESLDGTECGVFVGCGQGDYHRVLQLYGLDREGQAFMGGSSAILAARISYFLNLKGPSIAIDTACSSSLSAIHMARESLLRGECKSALVGGVTIFNSPITHVHSAQVRMLSRQGACRPFSASADGTLCAEGCGVIFLKRLGDAVRDGDPIVGVIRASGTNQDGRTNGITAPSGLSQKALIEAVYAKSGISPSKVSFIECHGTATAIGDPVEVGALAEVYCANAEKEYSCALGSVKGNIGHASFAAGIAGLIKALLCIQHKKLVPTLGFDAPNPHINFDSLPFYVNTEFRHWGGDARGNHYAAVSSFGFSGTNVHVVVSAPDESFASEASSAVGDKFLIPLSAKSKGSLLGIVSELMEYLKATSRSGGPVDSIRRIAYTLAVGRNTFECRAVFQATSVGELIAALEEYLRSGGTRGISGLDQAKSWMGGGSLDWPALFRGPKPIKLNLPGYVFEPLRCWPEGNPIASASASLVSENEVPGRQGIKLVAKESAKSGSAFELMRGVLGRQLKIHPSEIARETVLRDLGLDSIRAVKAAREISEALALELSSATVFGCSTIGDLERALGDALPAEDPEDVPVEASPSHSPKALSVPEKAHADERVAILGVSCAFPGASSKEAYWRNLRTGKQTIQETPEERMELWRLGKEPALTGSPGHNARTAATRWGGYLEQAYDFDPEFFGIPVEEVENMDPQHRLVLTHAYWALEDASIAPKSLSGRKVGVFVAISSDGHQGILEGTEKYSATAATGSLPSMAANRLSFILDVKGPSETIDVACSSSLVAIKKATDALVSGEVDLAIVAGVNLILSPFSHCALQDAGLVSKDGYCKAFSKDASGFVRSEGVGVLVLGLENAWEDREAYGIVRACSAGHGGRSNSLTAPNPGSQADVVLDAYARNDIDPRSIGFLETHGTGTPMGDQVEIEGLKRSFRTLLKGVSGGGSEAWRCPLGTGKTQIGHTELASGMASVIKVLWQFQEQLIPHSDSAATEDPDLRLDRSPFFLPRVDTEWAQLSGARRAGINAFGFGGVNAHLVLEEASDRRNSRSANAAGAWILLSARNEHDLRKRAKSLHDYLAVGEIDLPDLERTLAHCRDVFPTRMAFFAEHMDACLASLESYLQGRPIAGASIIHLSEDHNSEAIRILEGGLGKGPGHEWVRDEIDAGKMAPPRAGAKIVRLPGYPMALRRLTPTSNGAFPGTNSQTDVPRGVYLEEWASRDVGLGSQHYERGA